MVSVFADVASAADGLRFEWSPDNTNWDGASASALSAGQWRGFHVSHRARYFRIKYTNGAGAQGAFRLNTFHRPASVGLITRPLDDTIDDDNFASISRAILATKKTSDGTYVNISANANGRLIVTNENVLTDDAAFTPGTSTVGMIGATFDDAAPDSVNEGDGSALRMSGNRCLYVNVRDAAGNERGLNIDASGNLGISAVAHDAADSGNPHKIGAKAETSLSGVTLVADGDRTDLHAGVDGVLIVRPHCNLEDIVQERATNTDGASTAFASGLAAPGAGVRLYIKSVTIANSSSSFCTVDLRDGAAGSVLWTFPVPATGGVTHRFDPPLKLTANTALAYDASAAISTLTISANGFKSKV